MFPSSTVGSCVGLLIRMSVVRAHAGEPNFKELKMEGSGYAVDLNPVSI